MALTAQQSIDLYGTPAYVGWGETEAQYDAKAKGLSGGGGGGGGGADSILQSAINSFLQLIPSNLKPYEEVNPFFFDEELARKASTAEYAPYYAELLSDYTSDVERTKSRSQEDLQSTLEQLNASKEYYTGKERRVLDKALRSTNEGYAGRGLFFSGAKDRDIKELQTEYEKGYGPEGYYTGQYTTKAEEAKKLTGRTGEDVNRSLERYTRDTEREKKYAIESGVMQRKAETRDEYEISRKKYYENLFPGYYQGIA